MLFTVYQTIICAQATFNCSSHREPEDQPRFILLNIYHLITIIGLFLNIICVCVFFFTPRMNSRFLIALKLYSINSLLVSLSDTLFMIVYSVVNKISWIYNGLFYSRSLIHVSYFIYFHLPIWTILYTFGSCLDIYIVYGRIQTLCPKVKLFAKTSIYKVSILIMLLSIIINVPPNLGRQTNQHIFYFITNQSLTLFNYSNSIIAFIKISN